MTGVDNGELGLLILSFYSSWRSEQEKYPNKFVNFQGKNLEVGFNKCSGIIYKAITYIEKWNVLAFGCRDGLEHSVSLCNFQDKSILASVHDVHQGWIANVVWIDEKNYLLTGSLDYSLRIFRASNRGHILQAIHTLRGHSLQLRSLIYIKNEDMLVTAGKDANIKPWNINRLKRSATISTNSEDDMHGNITYIEADGLIGIAYGAGFRISYREKKPKYGNM